jgi:hypothetical protein
MIVAAADKGFAHFQHKVIHDYPGIQLNGWKLWPAAAMFNYRFVPLHLRVLFLNAVALGWCAPTHTCQVLKYFNDSVIDTTVSVPHPFCAVVIVCCIHSASLGFT